MKNRMRAFAAIAVVALFATACGGAPDTDTETEPGAQPTAPTETDETQDPTDEATPDAELLACMVTDTGGVDDRSFNQTSYEGLVQAQEELGAEISVLESTSDADFIPNINAHIENGCNLIVTVGFLLGEATQESAEANPDVNFAIVDFAYEEPIDNVRELVFSTDQAAFLAGYLAAGMTETGTVGTYGGINIPTVSIFMDGFLAGVRHHNAENGTNVEVLGWDGSEGLFTGNFESQEDGRQVTDQLLNNGADIIMPVAGPVGLGSAAAIEEAGTGKLIWVDTDGFESASQFSHLFLTSVMKNMDVAVFDTVQKIADGTFEGEQFVGTLENDGVGIAPFHDFEDEVPQELKDQLDQLRQGIIDGSISVESADYE